MTLHALATRPSTGLAALPPPSPTTGNEPVPLRGPKGVPFASVYEDVMRRADEMLPDQIVHLADLRMTPETLVALPTGVTYALNPWARKQLASMLGLRWDRWFQSASGEECAEEVNRRFSRLPGEIKVKAWRDSDDRANGVARAFLAPTFNPIGDARIFERMHLMMRGLLDEYRFTRVTWTDATTHYSAVHLEGIDVDGRGDLHHPGFHLRNSEVGASALSLDDYLLRLVCTNGLMVRVGGKRSLYRTHRAIEDDALAAALVIAIGRLPERAQKVASWLVAAKGLVIPHPDDAVEAVLGDSAEVPKSVVAEARRLALVAGDATRFGVVQAITRAAHEANRDHDVRFAMERLAGEFLAAVSS